MFSSFAFKRAFALAAGLVLGTSALPFTTPLAFAAKPAQGSAAKAAKQPIAVGVITGPQGPKVRARILKVLKESDAYEITDAEDVKPTDTPATFANTAKMLQVEAVVVGTVTKKVTLLISVYGANGAKIDTIELPGGTFPKLYKSVDNELEIAIADPLANAKGGNGGKAAGAAAVAAAPAPAPAAASTPAAGEDDSDIEITEGTPAEPAKPKDDKAKKSKGKPDAKKAAAAAAAVEVAEEDEEAPVEPSKADDSESDSASETKKGRRPFEATAGIRGYNRKFNYTDSTDPLLHSYSLAVGPALLLSFRVYPGAWFRDDILSHLGLQFRYEFGIPTNTQYPTTTGTIVDLTTKAGEWEIGVRGRFPIGPHEIGTSLSYGKQWFKLKGDETYGVEPYAVVPDVTYGYVRANIDGRLAVSKLIVGAHIAPRFVTSMNELDLAGVWFPGATGSGLDFGLMGGWQLLPYLSVVGGLDVVRYGFDFNAIPDDNRVVAGGATDTYLSLWVGAMFYLDAAVGKDGASIKTSAE